MAIILESAKKGENNPLFAKVAEREGVTERFVRDGIAQGRIVLPYNPVHSPLEAGIGAGLRVKVNANIGTSRDMPDLEPELEKMKIAVKYGADQVMDLSTGGDIDAIRCRLLKECPVIMGSVPIYEIGLTAARKNAIVEMTEDDIFKGIEMHAKDGMDFMTVHCGITKETVELIKDGNRLMDVVSRGGSFLTAWIIHNEEENPLYKNFDYLLDLARKYEFTLSLGDGFRPGCIHDATDSAQIQELSTLGRLVKRSREQGVQAMVEGPGHMKMDEIAANIKMEKKLCHGAPFYTLGPLVTDIAPGYDHITSAIGGAIAAANGADFLCFVTPAEHLSLPDKNDVKEGVIAQKIAAHAADLTRGIDTDLDNSMAVARKKLDWNAMFDVCLDEEKARAYRKRGCTNEDEGCSMCGDVCAVKIVNEYLIKEDDLKNSSKHPRC